ncbi:MAG: ATP-binding cassette domain-containing protein [Alkalispirochaeta sp.]
MRRPAAVHAAVPALMFRWAGYLLPLLLWWAGAHILGIPLILPPPGVVFRETLLVLGTPSFLRQAGFTALRALGALTVSAVCAVPLGMAAGRNGRLHLLVAPTVTIVRAVPFISVILLSVIWFSSGTVPVFVAVLMVFPLLYQGGYTGVRSVDTRLEEMTRLFQCGALRRVRHLWLPGAMPTILGSLRASGGIAWKVTVAAEVLSVPRSGIGTGMGEARLFLETELVLAWTVVLILLASVTDRVIAYWESRLSRRETVVSEQKSLGCQDMDVPEPSISPAIPDDPHPVSSGVSVALRNVSFSWDDHPGRGGPLLRDLNVTLEGGSVTALIGPSGVGKTTVLALLGRIVQPGSGKVEIVTLEGAEGPDGDRERRDTNETASYRPGMVFQEPRLLPWRRVVTNLTIVGRRPESAYRNPEEMLRLVQLPECAHRYPDQLSGGMQQRVNLARALYARPDLLLVDEPLSGLDQAHRAELSGVLRKIMTAGEVTTVLSSHDMDLVYAVADRILLLEERPVVIALDRKRGDSGWTPEQRREIEGRLESSRHTLQF